MFGPILSSLIGVAYESPICVLQFTGILAIKGQTRNTPVIISLCSNSQKLQICVEKFVYSIWYIIQVHTDALAQWAPNLLITGSNPGPFLALFSQK